MANLDETTETDEQEESKGEGAISLDEAVHDVSEIVEGYKKALIYQNSENNAEFSPTKVMKTKKKKTVE